MLTYILRKCKDTGFDLNTKRSVAYYAAIAVFAHSAYVQASWPNVTGLLVCAGLMVTDALVVKKGGSNDGDPGQTA